MEETVVTESNSLDNAQFLPNLLSTLFGKLLGDMGNIKMTEIHMEKKCVKKCPEKSGDKKVIVDESRKICFAEDKDSPFSFLSPH